MKMGNISLEDMTRPTQLKKVSNAICQLQRKLHDPFFHSAPSLVDQRKKKKEKENKFIKQKHTVAVVSAARGCTPFRPTTLHINIR